MEYLPRVSSLPLTRLAALPLATLSPHCGEREEEGAKQCEAPEG